MPAAIISGRSTLIGLLADPVDHIRAPEFLDPLLAAHGIDAHVLPMHVRPPDLATVLAALRLVRNFAGVILTMPHKQAGARLCAQVGRDARLAGAVNVIRFLPDGGYAGDMLDGAGLLRAMAEQNVPVRGRHVLLLGAGAVARAIAVTFLQEGAAAIAFASHEPGQAEALAAVLRDIAPETPVQAHPWPADPAGFALVVNATPLGLHDGDQPPLDPRLLRPEMDLVEVNAPIEWTALRAAARRIGCRTVGGRAMADRQVGLYVEFFGLAAAI